jgi:hypothetical protein
MTALLMWSIVSKFKTLKQWFEFQSEVDRYISSIRTSQQFFNQ